MHGVEDVNLFRQPKRGGLLQGLVAGNLHTGGRCGLNGLLNGSGLCGRCKALRIRLLGNRGGLGGGCVALGRGLLGLAVGLDRLLGGAHAMSGFELLKALFVGAADGAAGECPAGRTSRSVP